MADGGLLAKIPESERKKVMILGALFAVLVASVIWNFSGSSASAPPSSAANNAPRDPNRVRNVDLQKGTNTGGAIGPAGTSTEAVVALNINEIAPPASDLAVKRNPFAYPPPPPPPRQEQPKEPPPPTIPIGTLSPSSAVAGVPRGLTLTVNGNQFPADAQVLWNGRAVRTEVLGPTQLRATLAAGDIASPGSVTIKVVSASQPGNLWSREIPFTLSPPPTPPFRYIGRIGDEAVLDFGTATDGRKRVRVGDVVGVPAQWKILAVGKDQIEILDTRNEIRRTVALAKKT